MPRKPGEAYDAGNPEHVEDARITSKTRNLQRLEGLGMILDHPSTRAWLRELLGFCGIRRMPFVAGSTDATAFNCGMQNVGHKIEAELVKHYEKSYVQFLTEGANNAGSDT